MIFNIFIIISIIISIECKEQYHVEGEARRNEIERCYSRRDDSRTYESYIGNLQSRGYDYNDINSYTSFKAKGDLELYTRASGPEKETDLLLKEYAQQSSYKQFTKTWRRATTSGWAAQTVAIGLTVNIYRDGRMYLKNYVYAGSWGAFSCASAKAFVDVIEIDGIEKKTTTTTTSTTTEKLSTTTTTTEEPSTITAITEKSTTTTTITEKIDSNESSTLSTNDLIKIILANSRVSEKKDSNENSALSISEMLIIGISIIIVIIVVVKFTGLSALRKNRKTQSNHNLDLDDTNTNRLNEKLDLMDSSM